MTRSATNWHSQPGGWDTTHVRRRQYPSQNRLGIPDLQPLMIPLPQGIKLLSYAHRDDQGRQQARSICHFFLDDYRFEACWTRPDAGLHKVQHFWGTLTPDFSLYADWPEAVQLWNTYRTRWLGCYWQEHDVPVIPTVNWSTPASFAWCFLGIPKHQVIALATPDLRRTKVAQYFHAGFDTMLERLEPKQILVYGKLPFACELCIEYEPDWKRLQILNK